MQQLEHFKGMTGRIVKVLGDGVTAEDGTFDPSKMNHLTKEGLQQLLDAMEENMKRLTALESEKLELLAEIARLKGFNADLLQKIADAQLVERSQSSEIALLTMQLNNAKEKVAYLENAYGRSQAKVASLQQEALANAKKLLEQTVGFAPREPQASPARHLPMPAAFLTHTHAPPLVRPSLRIYKLASRHCRWRAHWWVTLARADAWWCHLDCPRMPGRAPDAATHVPSPCLASSPLPFPGIPPFRCPSTVG